MIKRIIAWLNEPARESLELIKVDGEWWLFRYVPDTPRWKIFSKHGRLYSRHLSRYMTDYHYVTNF